MKTTIASFLLVSCGLLLAGCSSTPTKVDNKSISARTFSFVNPGKPVPEYAENRQQVHALVQVAITQSLARRNVSHVEQGGDVTVAYLIVTGNNAATAAINDYFGYGRDATELLDKAHDRYTGSRDTSYFEGGTLLIDIIDSKSGKVLKRGYATRELLRNVSLDVRAARLSEVVEEILADVRFEQ
jgi:hypothetical protein